MIAIWKPCLYMSWMPLCAVVWSSVSPMSFGCRQSWAIYTKLIDVTAKAADVTDITEQAKYFRDEVKTTMDELRAPADKLEMIVDKEFWPFPSYGDLLFEV